MVSCVRVKNSGLGWKQLLAISSSTACSVLPFFLFSAFSHGILFLKMIVIDVSFCSSKMVHLTSSCVFLSSMLCTKFISSQIKQNKFLSCHPNFRSYVSLSRQDQNKSDLSSFITHAVICRSCFCNSTFPRCSFKLKPPEIERLIAFYNTEAKG